MTFTVRQVAEQYAVSVHTVLAWIGKGELRAVNVARSVNGGKPRWRIKQEHLEAFEAKRTPGPPPVRKRRRRESAVEQFY